MHVTLDGEILQVQASTLAAVLDAARVAADLRKRVLVEARIDGQSITDEQLASAGSAIESVARIELVSAEPRSLVRLTLLELVPLLDEAVSCQERAAEHFAVGQAADALPQLSRAFEIWDGVQRAVGDGMALLGFGLEEVGVTNAAGERDTVTRFVTQLSQHLREVKRALQANDVAGLNDVLLYDLKDEARGWQSLLTSLADLTRADRAS